VQSAGNYIILLCCFVTGYLVSRIFVKTGLAAAVVIGFTRVSNGHISYLLLFLVGSSALLSSFIPNTVTVLALIPVLRIINRQYKKLETKKGQLSTPIVMSIIYGANIGGMSSIIGSPANAILMGFLPLLEKNYNTSIAGREGITFVSWLAFGVPTAAILVLIAWALIFLLLVPKNLKRAELDFSSIERRSCPPKLRSAGLILSIAILATWIVISVAQTNFPWLVVELAVLSIILSAIFVLIVFFAKVKVDQSRSEALLQLKEIFSGIPGRGLLIALAAACLSGALMLLRVPDYIGAVFSRLDLTPLIRPMGVYITIALIVTYLTEFISNTTVALTFFPIITVLSLDLGLNPLASLLLVSLSTTCAFMSPIATPVNALAFGSLKGVSLGKMIFSGFLMNMISATVLSLAVLHFAIPLFSR
jgi:sodium-dependent dicarboxylate transporter 2/3/5